MTTRRTPARINFLTLLMLLAVFDTGVASAEALTITRVSGAVKVAVAGREVPVRVGSTVEVPVRIETGADGSLRAEQASSTLDVGPNSVVLLPGATKQSVEKILQQSGRVLYSVKPRKARTFAVETPYLVSVVKGTMFTVAIEDRTTAVALLEGSVELVADGIEPVLLQPNEAASRSEGARAISVTKIDGAPPSVPPQAQLDTSAGTPPSSPLAVDASLSADTLADLNQLTAAHRADQGASVTTPSTPSTPETPASPAPVDPPTPATPTTPTTDQTPTAPTPGIDPVPVPTPTDDDDDCLKKHCDDDDHNQGGGDDKD